MFDPGGRRWSTPAAMAEKKEPPGSVKPPAPEVAGLGSGGPAVELWLRFGSELVGAPEYTPGEVARETGLDIERLRELWRALGFPPAAEDRKAFSGTDIGVLKEIVRTQEEDGTDDKDVTMLARVSGQSLARIAETQVEMLAVWAAQGDLSDISRVAARLRAVEPFLGYIWRRHLTAALGRKLVAAEDLSAQNVRTVGFADLVGFTRLARSIEQSELAEVVEHFERSVDQAVPQNNGRIVKMIGDEVMFTADTAADSAEIALRLIELHETDSVLPEIRVGMSRGPVLAWEGDLYGPTVNLASRLADAARPSTVLISGDLADGLEESSTYRVRRKRAMRLKGMGRVKAARLMRS